MNNGPLLSPSLTIMEVMVIRRELMSKDSLTDEESKILIEINDELRVIGYDFSLD